MSLSCRQTPGRLKKKNSDNSLESGKIEVQEKLKNQDEKRIMKNVENGNIDVVKDTNSTKMGASLPE